MMFSPLVVFGSCFFVALGCSTSGSGDSGTASTGGSGGAASDVTGGVGAMTGGAPSSSGNGGVLGETGGAAFGGGAPTASGGAIAMGSGAAGGTSATSGGASGTGGRPSGDAGGAIGAGGSSSTCYSGPTSVMDNTDYVSRKWARWPVPTPPSLDLPNPMTYTDLGNGTVRDEVTGLVWEQTIDGTTRTWQDAIANCENLALDGGGWTLPTRIELTSILDATQASGPRVNGQFFKFAAKSGWTWASTPWVVDSRKTVSPPLSWFINFSEGDSNNSLDQTAASAYDRCVRVPPAQTLPATHYAIADGEVTDNYTCLVWQQDGSATTPTLSWDQAESYCQTLSLNGHTWRLPTLNELASVVDDVPTGNVSPAVDHDAFPNTSADQWYWAATPYGSSTTDEWSLNFEDGFTKHQATTVLGIARCVR